ncbi:fluoride efflux transporter FluC [Mangrovibacillus cuniculi]|uniref:Fluoride-specific ion channel FluC n=1 Tax=Mangrovibacillus cuniculi TaxID=2593652 RepID=A0A7S8CAE1_9BACI|nr:CrcB family protein [Mangrovibacillus cuniculi]QPC46168.1 CrcB family protein [Mangrovibacillus cuniculi]
MNISLLVMLGGAIGALLRYSVFITTPSFFNTWFVNILGCLFFGFLSSVTLSNGKKAFLLTGFCGSFTTMSALMGDAYYWFQESHYIQLFSWICFHICFGLSAVYLGKAIGRRVVK